MGNAWKKYSLKCCVLFLLIIQYCNEKEPMIKVNNLMLTRLFDWVVPVKCIVCGFQSPKEICKDCERELPWIIQPCMTCGAEIPSGTSFTQCGDCLIDPPNIDRIIVLFDYISPLPSLITKLKFQKKLRFAHPLGNLLAEKIRKKYLEDSLEFPEIIIPVPLNNKRLRTRGYNQAMEIARPIRKLLKVPIDYKSVIRLHATAPQTMLPASDRALNIKGAFDVKRDFSASHVAIVDDVVTTFSTMSEVAKVLRENGVKKVDAWCVAKANKN